MKNDPFYGMTDSVRMRKLEPWQRNRPRGSWSPEVEWWARFVFFWLVALAAIIGSIVFFYGCSTPAVAENSEPAPYSICELCGEVL